MSESKEPDNNLEDKEKNEGLTRRTFLAGAAITASAIAMGASTEAKATDKKVSGRPKSMLVKNALVLVTMDKDRREIKDGGMYIEDGVINKWTAPTICPKQPRLCLI